MFQLFTSQVSYVTYGIAGVLLVGTLVIAAFKSRFSAKLYTKLTTSMRSWWLLAILYCVAISFNKTLYIGLFALLALLAFYEFCQFSRVRVNKRVLACCHILIVLHYLVILNCPVAFMWVSVCISVSVIFVVVKLSSDLNNSLRVTLKLFSGIFICSFLLGHVAALINLEPTGDYSSAGVALFLVLLTELNDVFQFIWGKLFGRCKIVKAISPNKTLEGYLGGILTTTAVGLGIAPLLLPLNPVQVLIGVLIVSLGGCIGDLLMSAFKRYFKVKDTSALIPGHGGILDRLDSLCISSPLFFYYCLYVVS